MRMWKETKENMCLYGGSVVNGERQKRRRNVLWVVSLMKKMVVAICN